MLGLLLLTLSITADNILFMDETGFYQRQYYTHSWSPIGKPCYAKIDANKGKRLNLMGAMRLNEFKLIAPITFEGGCNRVIVENWLHTLAQSLPKDENGNYPKRVLVLDNARFHHGGDLKQIAELYNIELTYLPPYSPELNPIEQLWAVIKQKVRLTLSNFDTLKGCVESCLV
ncbi:DDE superfamily endonuclease [Moraxella atlantae]|uniref:DDE superfamily endonuclease n=2 Tax=Faucicola atlantae TaxID=34059 RepID=A0A378QLF6_9GAMM|nr:IS630 family transposase [Moraxella atlantae]STZ01726.1 DDE superfamily endonuclease [Moraxella atlantae]